MRLRFLLPALALLALPAMSYASPITYGLTLTPASGSPYGGSGSVTLASAPASTGISDDTPASGLTGLSFLIDGETFTLANGNPGSNPLVEFLNGSLYDITFAAQTGADPDRFSLATASDYAFFYNNGQNASYGTISASAGPATETPEPSTLILLGTGLIGTGLLGTLNLMRKRYPETA